MRQFVFVVPTLVVCLMATLLTAINVTEVLEKHPAANSILLKRPLGHITNFMLGELASEKNVGKNFVFSPLSIHMLLSMELASLDKDSSPIREALGYDSEVTEEDIKDIHASYSKIIKEFEWSLSPFGRLCDKCTKGQDPLAFDTMGKVVTKNNAPINQETKNRLLEYFHVSFAKVNDKRRDSKLGLLDQMGDWAQRVKFESPILAEKDLEGDFGRLLLAVMHVRSSWANSLSNDFDRFLYSDLTFYNGGLRNQALGVNFLMSKNVAGAKLLRFAPPEVPEEPFPYPFPFPRRPPIKKKFKPGETVPSRPPRKYMSKDLWVKYSKWNFTALKLDLREDYSLSIFMPAEKLPDNYRPKENDVLIHKLIQNLSSDKYALSQILTELDNKDYPTKRLEYVALPKFSFEYELGFDEMHGPLKKLNRAKPERRRKPAKTKSELPYPWNPYPDKHKPKKPKPEKPKPGRPKPVRTKFRAGFELTAHGIRGAGSGHHIEKRSFGEYGPNEHAYIDQPFLFLLRYKKLILLGGKVTKLSRESYILRFE